MISKNKFEFLKIRSTTAIVGDTLSFVQENFKSLFSSLFYICAPSFLVVIIGTMLFFNHYFDFIFSTLKDINYSRTNPDANELVLLIPYGLLMMLGIFFSLCFVITVTFCYVKLYKNKEEITTSTLWKSTKKYIFKIMGGQILVFFILLLIYFICLIPIFFLLGTDNYIFLAFFPIILLIVFIILAFYLCVKISFFQHFIIVEEKGIIESLKASFRFSKGVFWKIFFVILLLSLITSVLSNILQLPGIILIYASAILGITNGNDYSFISSLGTTLTGVGMAISSLLYTIVYLGMSVTYYSTLEERHGIKRSEEIDNIGKNN